MSASGRSLSRTLRILPRRALQRVEALWSPLYSPPYSLLSVHSDLAGWVLDQEAVELLRLARLLGIRAALDRGIGRHAAQCCHYTSQFVLQAPGLFATQNRISVDYFHGRPGSAPEFTAIHERLRRHHSAVSRVRVSHSEMEQIVLETGIEAGKLYRIPIGVNLAYFPVVSGERRRLVRRRLGLPESAVVVGSFQKDGVGWGEGNEPKLVKGPDVLLRALGQLAERVSELWVLLTGAARGYVRQGLEEAGIPYRHLRLREYARAAECFQALDAYLVPSRQEGGPKAVLEAMAARVPVVSTRVGQATDLVQHGVNGYLVDTEDAEGLTHWIWHVVSDSAAAAAVARAGRTTAEANSYESQRPLWASFFRGYVEGW